MKNLYRIFFIQKIHGYSFQLFTYLPTFAFKMSQSDFFNLNEFIKVNQNLIIQIIKYQHPIKQTSQMQSTSALYALSQPSINYRQRVKNRFQQQINQIVTKYSLTQLVIVLDATSAFLLSNIFTITQLVSMKILYIERLQKIRKKLDKHAVYFISPTKTNIELICKDFPLNQQIPQYRRIHVLFTTFIDKSLLKILAVNKGVLKRIAKNSLKQFYFSARILAPNLIDINLPYLALAFSKQSDEQEYRCEQICKKIIQFIANYESINTIRIFFKKSPNKVCQKISLKLQTTIKTYLGILLQNRSPNISKTAQDITILMMDRSIDTVTPFIHYFTYEALMFDFFKINMVSKSDLEDKGSYSYEQIQNPIYDQFRYKHLSQALSKLPEMLEDQKGKLQSLKQVGHETISIKQLTQTIASIKSSIQKLQAIWAEFQSRKIQDLADLEQSLATGITANAQNTSSVKLVNDVCTLIKDPNINKEQKIRLAILCLSCIKLSKEDYQTLLELFSNQDKKVLKNLIALGVSYDGSITKSTKTITKDQQKIAQKRMQVTGMPLNRYTSIVELVVPLFCKILQDPTHAQTIDKEVFGQLICSVFKSPQEQIPKFKIDRFAMCMIGGLSWSEISAVRNAADLENIVLMADSVMTAPQFIRQLGKINILNQ